MSTLKAIVYKVQHLQSGRVYIGATTSSLSARKQDHLQKAQKGLGGYFQEALGMYGPEAFSWEEIDTAKNPNELAEKERYYIRKFNADKSGFNRDAGGGFSKVVYQYEPETGHLVDSFESLQQAASSIGASHTSVSNAALGYNRTCMGSFWSYQKLQQYPVKDDRRCKSVIQLTLEGLMVDTYKSVAEASRATGISKTCISRVCRGERNQSGGFRWYYVS